MIGAAFLDGLVLASMVQDDARGSACVRGLAPGLARALRERLDLLAASSREERHRSVRALVSTLTAVRQDVDAPPRALAILAADIPREVSGRWSAPPPVRRGFRVTRPLKTALRRLASAGPSDARAQELAAAARASERDATGLPALRLSELRLSELRLSELRRWARALGDGDEERALGALVLGTEGDLAGDASSRRLRAIGHELAQIWEASWSR